MHTAGNKKLGYGLLKKITKVQRKDAGGIKQKEMTDKKTKKKKFNCKKSFFFRITNC